MAIGDTLNLTGYRLTFDDEFNSFSSNGPSNYMVTGGTGTWDTTGSYGERHLNDEQEFYSDPTVGVNPVSVGGGVLDIHAAPSADPTQTWGLPYTSGIITTNHSFNQEYGYFVMRAELPAGAGMWPAFWLLPSVHGWPPEADPLEAFGQTNNGQGGSQSFHTGLVTSDTSVQNQNQWDPTNGANLYTQYNTFAIQWTPTTITFFFDFKAYYSVPTPSDFHQRMYMLANLAVGGNWPGNATGESGDLKIDYIRAYSNDGNNPAVVQQSISSPDGGGKSFYGATDANGNGALGGAVTPPVVLPTTTLGSGPNTLALQLSENAYQGDAQFTISIDGVQIGGIQTVTASYAADAQQEFDVQGNFAPGQHSVAIDFLNDLYGGNSDTDRNLYLTGSAIDGTAVAGGSLSLMSGGAQSFTFQSPQVAPTTITTIGVGHDTLALQLSENAYQGDAQFTVSIDGTQIGGIQTATASYAAGATQEFDVLGNFVPGPHSVSINFLNDLYGNTSDTDRNLYLTDASIDGTTVTGASLPLMSSGPQSFVFQGPPIALPTTTTIGTGSDTLALQLSEDAYQGDAQFTISVDGTQVGGIQTVTASRALFASQEFDIKGGFSGGQHSIAINFLNDLYDGTPGTDRNLYLTAATIDRAAVAGASLSLMSSGSQAFSFQGPPVASPTVTTIGTGSDTLALQLSEDSYQGDAQFTISVDGTQVGGVQTVTSSRALLASQDFDIKGNFSAGQHSFAVNFINDLYDGTPGTDRNLYLTAATINGTAIADGSVSLMSGGSQSVSFQEPAPVTPPSELTLYLAEDVYQGDAQFTVAVDGGPPTLAQAVTALNSAGASQAFNFNDLLTTGTHDLAVTFTNNANGDTQAEDRNLYVKSADYGGVALSGVEATMYSNGTQHFSVVV